MVLTLKEAYRAFNLVIFDTQNGKIEEIILSDEFIRKVLYTNFGTKGYGEQISKLYFEGLGYTVKELYYTKEARNGNADLEITKGTEIRQVEAKVYPDTLKFNQLKHLFNHKGIIVYVIERELEDKVYLKDLEY